jgi:hypothetical protein
LVPLAVFIKHARIVNPHKTKLRKQELMTHHSIFLTDGLKPALEQAMQQSVGRSVVLGMETGMLSHGLSQHEFVPRLVEALVGKKVVGAAAGDAHTAVWTEEGELGAGEWNFWGAGPQRARG